MSNLNAGNEHSSLTLLSKSLSSLESTWSINELGALLEDFLKNILPAQRKLTISYFSCLSGVMERLMSECRRCHHLQANQIRNLQLALLQRILKAPVMGSNLVPLIAALRDLQLLSTAARDCIVEGYLKRLTEVEAEEADDLIPDLPVIFHHLLQLGDCKLILPVAQLWMARGAKGVAEHLLFLAGQGSKIIEVLFKVAFKNQSNLDPLTFALLLQSTRLPGVSLSLRSGRKGMLRQFISHLQELHNRHAQLTADWASEALPEHLSTPAEFLLQVARWLPDTEQSILAAIELAEEVREAGWLEEMFCCRPFARRELMRRAGRMFTNWPKLIEVDAEIVGEFFPQRINPFAGEEINFLGTEYSLPALKTAPLTMALKRIEEASVDSLPIPTIEDWTAIDDAEEAQLMAALLCKCPLNDSLNAQLFGLCELFWLGKEACPLPHSTDIRAPLCALAVHFAAQQEVEESRLGSLLAAVESGAVKLFPSTAALLLARGIDQVEGPLFGAAMEAVEDWPSIADISMLPVSPLVIRALTRLRLPFTAALQKLLWTAAEKSITQPASFSKLLSGFCESITLGSHVITKTSLVKLESISEPGLVKSLSKLLSGYGDAQVLDEMIKAVIIHFGAVEGEGTDLESPFGNLSNLTTSLRGTTMNARASESLFMALISHFNDRINQLSWLLQNEPTWFIKDWQNCLTGVLPIAAIWKSCFALSVGALAGAMQNMLASLYSLGERLIDACQAERECLSGLFNVLAVEITRRVYLLLPLQEAGNNHSSSAAPSSKKKSKTASNRASSTTASAGAASKLIFAIERFESKFLANRVEGWPQSLPRSTARDFKIVLENLK